LDRVASLRALASCVDSVRGHLRRAKSPSDVWWLEFRDGTTKEGDLVHVGVLKYFITPRQLSGLGYELKVYQVVQRLLEKRVTPNFVPTIATFGSVTERDLAILLRADPGYTPQWLDVLHANLDSMADFRTGVATMLPVHDPGPVVMSRSDSTPRRRRKELGLSAILTEALPNSLSLAKRLQAGELQGANYAAVLFQLVSLCYVMQCAKMVHGDLHSQNIMVVEQAAPITLAYVIENRLFEFKTSYTAHVFDFDRSFVAALGPNTRFKAHKHAPQYDLLTLLCFVAGSLYSDPDVEDYAAQQALLHDVFGVDLVNSMAESFEQEDGPCRNLQVPDSLDRSLLEYLERLERHLQPSEYYAVESDVFVCRASMFDASGRLTGQSVTVEYAGRTITR
jgi:hypothetical protein